MKYISNAKTGEQVESGTIFYTKAGSLRITVHRIIHCEGWFLTCRELGIEDKELKSEGLFKTIREAQMIVKKRIEKMQSDISRALEENIEISRY